MRTSWAKLSKKNRGQALVEFVLALPVLLFLLFGIVEFARLTFAWMAVQNAARFGIRYAVTGDFNDIYCIAAGNKMGAVHVNADVFGGDPQDCLIPADYSGADGAGKERELIDLARLFSIKDAATGGGTGLWMEPTAAGDYDQFLTTHNPIFIGQVADKGYFHVTTCSNRANQFVLDYNNYAIPLCVDSIGSQLMDDAGGPGDRVKVHIEHQHPLFLPILTSIWPSVSLNAERDGIVEKFRTSRVMGVTGPILSAPTWTQTPTITYTPTITPTSTPSVTPSPTNTPIPVDCDLIEVVNSYVGDWSSGYQIASVTIRNNNPVPIHLISANQDWEKNDPGRYYWAGRFHNSSWDILNDLNPATTWNPLSPIEMEPGGMGDYVGLFQPPYVGLEGNTSVDLEFDDGCHKGVAVSMATSTPTMTPTVTMTPTITPTPDCSLYTASAFNFTNYAMQDLTVRNNDVSDTKVTSIQFFWDYAEDYGAANGYNALNVDWFKWAGAYMGEGQDGTRDYDSSTIWSGNLNFNAGTSYQWQIDFDSDWGGGGRLTNVQNSDFGFVIDFQNGCQIVRNVVPRAILTWTPTATPTTTPTPSPVPPPTSTPLPTNTPLPTSTPLPTATPTITWTPSITPSSTTTPIPSHTSWPTNTPVPSNTPWPSITPIPPTSTPQTPSVTPSPAPPTPTIPPFD